jgi:hypothetical protein
MAGGGDTNTAAIIATTMLLRAVLLSWYGQRFKVTSKQINVRTLSDGCALVKGGGRFSSIYAGLPGIAGSIMLSFLLKK